MDYALERGAVAAFMRRLYRQKLTTTSGGNISVRVGGGDRVAITPAAIDKGRMKAAEVGVVTMDGENLTPLLRSSSETPMHLAIYQACPGVQAIVHAHPVTASTFSAAETPIDCELLSESYAILGEIVNAPYALTGTPELAAHVAAAACRANCILMKNHGVVALGRTLLEAFDRLELIEAAAQMTLITRQLQGVRRLDADERHALDRLMGRS